MNAERIIRNILISMNAILVLCLLGLGITACAPSRAVQPAAVSTPRPAEVELRLWREGVESFSKSDYEKALALFETLSESARDSEMSRKALFGLASTRLVLAKTQAEFNEAMVLLNCWKEIAPAEMSSEDPRLLLSALERFSEFSAAETPRPKTRRKDRDIVYSNFLACRNSLQLKEKEMERMKSRLESRDREIKKLKSQIESLEAIHQKFQERKQEVSSP
ncbi:MAG: hypothetical protein GX422_17975 [Deltaproteobacteria bacterium]|jgi:predicted translin family RNA/ssDNA-binding protein|nr:hypothetical protein [Deltaproteobacteria bacterium]